MDQIYMFYFYLKAFTSLQIVVGSSFCLFLGVAIQIWTQVMKTGKTGAFELETHGIGVPKKQRLKMILLTFICSAALLVAALQSLNGMPPFEGPMDFVYLIAIFALIAGVGITVQINHPKYSDYSVAILVATALSFMFVSAKNNFTEGSISQTVALLFVLAMCGYLAKKVFFPQWISKAKIAFVLSFAIWLLVFTYA